MTAQIRQIPPPVVSNSKKSVCHTRFLTVGGFVNTLRRSFAQTLRSARNPVGSSSPRRRKARSTVESDTSWPSARMRAAILRCPQAGQSCAYFADSAS
ncbi:hypothetical protein C8K36_11349 [Rhodococcus sp. OK519]|uniref:hypothetical protein n=1 Tax=Rhodococcus sp. OK519 TaxID=2135729 RepID=UPI000D36BDAD|nr:hypothetical protein C8K36_11349 [Rhodococcus sp. OK519]